MAVNTTIQMRRDTAANWTSVNPTLAAGESGFETDTNKFKIGDGTTAWSTLAYQGESSTGAINSVLPLVSTYYYTVPASNSSVNIALNLAGFVPLFVPQSTTFDRIHCRTGASFSGSGVVRLGIYNDTDGKPSTVVLDAGTVATSVANTAYEITISQTLSAGLYWLASVSQTVATTNNYRSSLTIYLQNGAVNTGGGGQNVGWVQTGVSGAFATAAVTGQGSNVPTVWLRKA